MRPPPRSIRHTKTPRADHNTACLTSIAPSGSIAAHRSPSRDAGGRVRHRGERRSVRPAVAQEQRWRAALVMADGHPFPPPPVLGRLTLGPVHITTARPLT